MAGIPLPHLLRDVLTKFQDTLVFNPSKSEMKSQVGELSRFASKTHANFVGGQWCWVEGVRDCDRIQGLRGRTTRSSVTLRVVDAFNSKLPAPQL